MRKLMLVIFGLLFLATTALAQSATTAPAPVTSTIPISRTPSSSVIVSVPPSTVIPPTTSREDPPETSDEPRASSTTQRTAATTATTRGPNSNTRSPSVYISTYQNGTIWVTASIIPTETETPKSEGGSQNIPVIIGSVCGFVAILAIGFGYAFFSKTRKNRKKERVFGTDEDIPPPPPVPFDSPRPGNIAASPKLDNAGGWTESPAPPPPFQNYPAHGSPKLMNDPYSYGTQQQRDPTNDGYGYPAASPYQQHADIGVPNATYQPQYNGYGQENYSKPYR